MSTARQIDQTEDTQETPKEERDSKPVKLKKILQEVENLPTIPVVAFKIGQMVSDPASDAKKIASLMRTDQSLTVAVLKLANSSYYGIPGGVTNITQAISFLGFNTLYQLVLTASVFQVFRAQGSDGIDIRELWKHSIGCGAMAETISRHLRHGEPEVCFTAGLLHDIGKVALLHTTPDRLHDAVRVAKAKGIALHQAEREVGLPDHARVGERLAEKWKFPMPLRIAIQRRNYQDEKGRILLPPGLAPYADITSLSDSLVREMSFGDPGDIVTDQSKELSLERLNLTQSAVESIRDDLMRAIERSRLLLELLFDESE